MPKVFKGIHESPRAMTFPLILLSSLSFFIFYTLPYLNPFSDHGWFTELIQASDSVVKGNPTAGEIYEGIHHAHYPAMALSLLVAGFGIGMATLMYMKKNERKNSPKGKKNKQFFDNKQPRRFWIK